METVQTVSVDQRLSRLEKENRRLRLLGLASIAGLVVVVLLGAAQNQIPDEIVTRRLVVVGPHNDPRAVFESFPTGAASLSIFKPDNGGRVVRLSCNPHGMGELTLWDNAGVQVALVPAQK